jgi:hypothetical protein
VSAQPHFHPLQAITSHEQKVSCVDSGVFAAVVGQEAMSIRTKLMLPLTGGLGKKLTAFFFFEGEAGKNICV